MQISITKVSIALFVGLIAACSSAKKPWPDRELVRTSTNVGPHRIEILLPPDLGVFEDPNGKIWRSVTADYAFFIKVFAVEHPDSLAAAIEDLYLEPDQKIVSQEEIDDGYEIIVQEPGSQHTVRVWKKRGNRAVNCTGILGEKIGDAAMIAKSNAWIHRICSSLTLQE